jgi:hypothetical protein
MGNSLSGMFGAINGAALPLDLSQSIGGKKNKCNDKIILIIVVILLFIIINKTK